MEREYCSKKSGSCRSEELLMIRKGELEWLRERRRRAAMVVVTQELGGSSESSYRRRRIRFSSRRGIGRRARAFPGYLRRCLSTEFLRACRRGVPSHYQPPQAGGCRSNERCGSERR